MGNSAIPLPKLGRERLYGRSPLWWAIAFCLLSGLILRWVNLGGKVFWYDEVFTALRVTGHLDDEVSAHLLSGVPFTAQVALQYQTFAPDSTFSDTWRSLLDHPEHPPLFYLLCWGWVRMFGTSMAAFRTVSVIASHLTLIVLPCLAWELLASVTAAVIAPLVFSVSPVHLLYAQEARQYALWTLTLAIATWALRRAVRLNRWPAWGWYALSLALTFYTSVLSVFVAIAHGLYAVYALKKRQRLAAVGAIVAAIALFSPWLVVMAVNRQQWQQATSWTTAIDFPKDMLAKLWGLHFAAVVIDLDMPLDHPYSVLVPVLFGVFLVSVLWVQWRHLPPASGVLLVMLIVVPTACLIGGDMLRGSILSRNTRYFMPALLGTLIALAGWWSWQYRRAPKLTAWCLTGVLTFGLINCGVIVQAPTWWNKSISYHNRAIATEIGEWPHPILLFQTRGTVLGDILSLSHYLAPETELMVLQTPTIPQLPASVHTTFLFQPSAELVAGLACPLEELPVEGGLYRVPCR